MSYHTVLKKSILKGFLCCCTAFPLIADAEGTADVGQIAVGGSAPGNGLMIQEDTPKARSTVTSAAIGQNSSLNNAFQQISLLPGVNSYSYDATGLFGGGLRMRGFNSDQLGITIDGVPVNDAGNFAVYPQEFTDPENLQEIFITQGSTDTDAPHVGASGGNIGLVTTNPLDQFRTRIQETVGANNASKTFVRLDTGYLGATKLKSFISYSEASADKWKGAGKADRKHLDFKSVLDISPGSSVSASFLWNKTFTHNLRTLSLQEIATLGRNADFGIVAPQHLTSVGGAPVVEVAPSNGYYNLNLNPFDDRIATINGNFQLTPLLRLDVESYYWYGYGTGGNELRTLTEGNSATLLGGGVRDINNNGNTLDTVMVYSGSLTETHRPGISFRFTSQIDNHKLMFGYWYEHARHHKTQPAVRFDNAGNSVDPWLQNQSNYILLQNGAPFQGRNFLTVNTADSLFFQDDIGLMNDRLDLVLGLRNTSLTRDFTNFASNGGGDGADYTVQGKYSKTLPSLGARYQLDNERQIFFNVAENFRAPPDSVFYGLVNGGTIVNGVLTGYTLTPVHVTAETSTNWDLGYRYAGNDLSLSGSLYYIDFRNRIASAYDPVNATNTNYNVGNAIIRGGELESAWRFQPGWSIYGSLTYTDSRMNQNLMTGANVFEATAGKQFPDVPNWMAGVALQYRNGPLSADLSAKYTGKRYSTLVNDESIGGFTLYSFDASYHLPSAAFIKDPLLRFNVYNLFNTNYLYLNSGSGAGFTVRSFGAGASAPSYYVGAPRTFSMMLSADF